MVVEDSSNALHIMGSSIQKLIDLSPYILFDYTCGVIGTLNLMKICHRIIRGSDVQQFVLNVYYKTGRLCWCGFDLCWQQYVSRVPCPCGLPVVTFFPNFELDMLRYHLYCNWVELTINQWFSIVYILIKYNEWFPFAKLVTSIRLQSYLKSTQNKWRIL